VNRHTVKKKKFAAWWEKSRRGTVRFPPEAVSIENNSGIRHAFTKFENYI
jgi:hypothetical protein